MPKLTKKVIDSNLPKAKDYIVWDDEIKGFGCRIFPGGKKTYVFYYRAPVTRKFSYIKIGLHGNLTVDEARIKAKTFALSVSNGIDVKAKKKQEIIEEQQSVLFADFWEVFTNKYICEHHKPSTIRGNKSRIKKHILPFFGTKKITDIERRDILDFKDSLSDVKGNCTKCLTLLTTAFDQAELWGYRDQNSNPCKGVKKQSDKKMERFLTAVELKKLEEVLTSQSSSNTSPYSLAAIWMLMFTGCRAGEIFTLQWEGVHLDDGHLYLKDSKVGVRTIALNDKAKQILASLPKQEGNPYVFCGKLPGTCIQDVKRAWNKIRTLAGIPDVRIHDLRHSFASFALKEGVDLYTVSKLLGHKNIATTTRYAHLELGHLTEATNKVAGVFGRE